ncbi:unnamed protein product [Calypogeia fissa]
MWVDTSDEDESEPNPSEENSGEYPKQDDSIAPEVVKENKAVAQENGAEKDSSEPGAMEHDREETNNVAPATADIVETMTNLDELMNTQTSASPDQEAGEKKNSTHSILVHMFSDFLHQLASPNSQAVPNSILESQEVSHVFNSTTPFVDLMLAETQPSTPSHKIQKLLAEVDTQISKTNGKSNKGQADGGGDR